MAQSPNLQLDDVLDPKLLECPSCDSIILSGEAAPGWPPPWCLPPSCVALRGNRAAPPISNGSCSGISSGCSSSSAWASSRSWASSLTTSPRAAAFRSRTARSTPPSLKDDVIALVLEAMCRQTKAGLVHGARSGCHLSPRAGLDLGRRAPVGYPGPGEQRDKPAVPQIHARRDQLQQCQAARNSDPGTTSTPAAASFATLTDISETLTLLKQRFETFHYGRSYYNTLSGIVWTIAALSLLRDLRTTLGIPPAFDEPHELVPAAYDVWFWNGLRSKLRLTATRPIRTAQNMAATCCLTSRC